MRSLLCSLATALALVLALPGGFRPALARNPTIAVTPEKAPCIQPFEVRAAGLPPNHDVEVEVRVDGLATGSVTGATDSLGQFFSPIPMILLPCAEGGAVSVSLITPAEFAPLTADFRIAEPVVAPPSPTAGLTADAAVGTPQAPEVGTGPSPVPDPSAASSLWVLIVIGTFATGGIAATWITRPNHG